jgi:hypothetical protein
MGAIVAAATLASLGSVLDVFQLSPLEPFTATGLGLAVGIITVVFVLSPLRRRDMLR